jgi:tight adherence protein C
MLASGWMSMLAFLCTSSLLLLLFAWRNRDLWQTRARVRDLTPGTARPASQTRLGGLGGLLMSKLPGVGRALLPDDEEQRGRLQQRLVQAGLYGRAALPVFLGVKMLLLGLGILLALPLALLDLLSPGRASLLGLFLFGLALLAPGLWLDARKRRRQTALRRALPDALDMLVLCVEGGISLHAAIIRVTAELRTAHPLLADEMQIVHREMMLGQSAGEALRKFAARSDLEDVRSLASVLIQNERFGAGIVKALRVYSDSLRLQRQQRAEELAQKAAVKILFPTLLCIFPAIFIVILGPAAFQILQIFERMK